MCMYVCMISAADARSAPPLTRGVRAPGRQKKRKEKEPKTLSAELARLTPDTWQQSVGRSVATATAMAVQRASYAVCEGVFVRRGREIVSCSPNERCVTRTTGARAIVAWAAALCPFLVSRFLDVHSALALARNSLGCVHGN